MLVVVDGIALLTVMAGLTKSILHAYGRSDQVHTPCVFDVFLDY